MPRARARGVLSRAAGLWWWRAKTASGTETRGGYQASPGFPRARHGMHAAGMARSCPRPTTHLLRHAVRLAALGGPAKVDQVVVHDARPGIPADRRGRPLPGGRGGRSRRHPGSPSATQRTRSPRCARARTAQLQLPPRPRRHSSPRGHAISPRHSRPSGGVGAVARLRASTAALPTRAARATRPNASTVD